MPDEKEYRGWRVFPVTDIEGRETWQGIPPRESRAHRLYDLTEGELKRLIDDRDELQLMLR